MTVANWLATYWIHSTLALGAVWVLERCLPHRLRILEAAWKVALLAGLVTATLQLSLGIQPLGGRRRLPWNAPAQAHAASARVAPLHAHRPVHPILPTPAAAPVAESTRPLGLTLFVGGWALGGGLALAGLLFSWRRFARRLADRRELADMRVHERMMALSGASGSLEQVRLTQSSALDVPLAIGVVRREICVPERALAELDGERIDALLAHELAHLTRRDPVWLLVSSLISRALLLQPLNYLAARRIASYAELACDDLAAEWTRHPLALAHCLADVAGWLVKPRAALAPAMAGTPSLLRRRVERLLDSRRAGPEALPRWFPTAAVVAVACALAFAPSCASWDEGTPPQRYAAMASPPPPPPAAAPNPQLAIIAEPIPDQATPRRHHHVRVRPVIVQTEAEADENDDDSCHPDADADDDDDDADDEVSSALDDLPDQIAEAMESINEAREAISAEALAEIEKDVQEAIQEARRSQPSRAELAQVEQQVRKAMAQAQQSIERARRNFPQREELERVQEEVRRAVEGARRDNRQGDLERLDQEIERSKRETERLKEERRRLRESRWD